MQSWVCTVKKHIGPLASESHVLTWVGGPLYHSGILKGILWAEMPDGAVPNLWGSWGQTPHCSSSFQDIMHRAAGQARHGSNNTPSCTRGENICKLPVQYLPRCSLSPPLSFSPLFPSSFPLSLFSSSLSSLHLNQLKYSLILISVTSLLVDEWNRETGVWGLSLLCP